jgi:hypothetical protein
MSSNLKLLRRFFEYLDAAGSGSIGVRELEEPLISVVGSQAGGGVCVWVCLTDWWACVRAKLMFGYLFLVLVLVNVVVLGNARS